MATNEAGGQVAGERGHTVLIVDDEVQAARLLARMLSAEYAVHTANGGAEALDHLDEWRPDVVVADQRMPGMTGVELLAAVRERLPDTIRILLTAYTDPQAMIDAINRGEVYRFVFKPWNPVEMRVELRRAVERLDLQRDNARLLAELRGRNADLERALADLSAARDRLLRTEKLALAGRIASGFAHDTRNLLVAMMGLESVARAADDPAVAEMVEYVRTAADDLKAMVGEIGAAARGEVPGYQRRPGDLSAIVRDLAAIMARAQAMRGRTLHADCPELPHVPMAAGRIRRLALNLLQNAAEAAPEGGTVRVRVFGEADHVCLSVSDDGPGIPPEMQEHIWEPLVTTKAQGTGLGLDICRTIAAGHGGRIDLVSEPGKGATFTLRLPIE